MIRSRVGLERSGGSIRWAEFTSFGVVVVFLLDKPLLAVIKTGSVSKKQGGISVSLASSKRLRVALRALMVCPRGKPQMTDILRYLSCPRGSRKWLTQGPWLYSWKAKGRTVLEN